MVVWSLPPLVKEVLSRDLGSDGELDFDTTNRCLDELDELGKQVLGAGLNHQGKPEPMESLQMTDESYRRAMRDSVWLTIDRFSQIRKHLVTVLSHGIEKSEPQLRIFGLLRHLLVAGVAVDTLFSEAMSEIIHYRHRVAELELAQEVGTKSTLATSITAGSQPKQTEAVLQKEGPQEWNEEDSIPDSNALSRVPNPDKDEVRDRDQFTIQPAAVERLEGIKATLVAMKDRMNQEVPQTRISPTPVSTRIERWLADYKILQGMLDDVDFVLGDVDDDVQVKEEDEYSADAHDAQSDGDQEYHGSSQRGSVRQRVDRSDEGPRSKRPRHSESLL